MNYDNVHQVCKAMHQLCMSTLKSKIKPYDNDEACVLVEDKKFFCGFCEQIFFEGSPYNNPKEYSVNLTRHMHLHLEKYGSFL